MLGCHPPQCGQSNTGRRVTNDLEVLAESSSEIVAKRSYHASVVVDHEQDGLVHEVLAGCIFWLTWQTWSGSSRSLTEQAVVDTGYTRVDADDRVNA
jgi:hypothetical protein